MVKQRVRDRFHEYDRIAGALHGEMILMIIWLREHGYDTEPFAEVARTWVEWASENSLVFNHDIPFL
jgi:hypothetical protein